MQSIHFSGIAVTLVLFLTTTPLRSAESTAPWYQFEIIIFERIAKGAGSTEAWTNDPGTPSRLDARPMRLRPPKSGDTEAVAYKTLPKSAWRLTELEQRLRRSRNYRPHVHLAWLQQMVHPDRAQPLYLEMMDKRDAPNRVNDLPKIEGTLKVGIKRYLHLETDLLLRRRKAQGSSSAQTGMLSFSPDYQAYRLQSHRRMRSEKLHYLDHPVLGVLAFASRYAPPKPVEPEITAPESTDQQEPPADATPADDPKTESAPAESQSSPAQ